MYSCPLQKSLEQIYLSHKQLMEFTVSCFSCFSVDLVDDDKNPLSTSLHHSGGIFVLGKECP